MTARADARQRDLRMPMQPGASYVLMREQDIAARRFDLARVTYQCD